jgi:cobalt-zinc-cadmium efflux system membrane fusion protein
MRRQSSIGLPEEAVQSVEGRDVVFVKTAKGFQATNVTVGQRSGGPRRDRRGI